MARHSLTSAVVGLALFSLPALAQEGTTRAKFEVYPANAKVYGQRVNENGWDYLSEADQPVLLSRKAHFNRDMAVFKFEAPGREPSEEKTLAWTKVSGDNTVDTGITLKAQSPMLAFQDWRHFTPWSDIALGLGLLGLCGLAGLAFWLLKENRKRKAEEAYFDLLAKQGVSVNQQIGRYFCKNKIGEGGGGTIYRALPVNNPNTDAAVALKMLDAKTAQDRDFKERFQREIEATSKLFHPNIINVHDADEVSDGSDLDGTLYFVMDLLNGVSLETYLRNHKGPLDPELVGNLIAQAADGLHHAHIQGLVHRDVKGDNLFFVDNDRVVVIDFGLARKPKQTIQVTRDSKIPGSTLYMPPEAELIETEEDEIRYYKQSYDQFSLAILAFEMLTRGRPFVTQDGLKNLFVMDSIHYTAIKSVRDLQPHLSPDFDPIFQRALARNPEERYPTIVAFAEALLEVCEAQTKKVESENLA